MFILLENMGKWAELDLEFVRQGHLVAHFLEDDNDSVYIRKNRWTNQTGLMSYEDLNALVASHI